MNKEQQQIIDEVYERYSITAGMSTQVVSLTKDTFIHYIKTDVKFSETWGIKIEERELSLLERTYSLGQGKAYKGIFGYSEKDDLKYKELFDKGNRPTKLITLTYNNETIESYE